VSASCDKKRVSDVTELGRDFPGLRLLVLHGSRARGSADAHSDWDFAFMGDPDLDALELRRRIADALRSDRLDLVNLHRCGGLLRYRIARDGVLLFESSPGLFDDFRIEAALFWFDVAPIVRREQAALLEALR
jgi:predicted nucleotidyltransferase